MAALILAEAAARFALASEAVLASAARAFLPSGVFFFESSWRWVTYFSGPPAW